MRFPAILLALLLPCLSAQPVAAQADSLSTKLKRESVEKLADDALRFGDPTRGALAFYEPTMN